MPGTNSSQRNSHSLAANMMENSTIVASTMPACRRSRPRASDSGNNCGSTMAAVMVTQGRAALLPHNHCVTRDKRTPRSRPAAEIYLRFLQLSETIRGLPSLPPLDPLEERILGWVARATRAGDRLSVRDMMAKDELGAPATIHGRLKSMREKGWIMLADTEDARRKQVELTDDALRHFAQLSRAVVKAAKGT